VLIALIGALLAFTLGLPLIAVSAVTENGVAALLGQFVVDAVCYSFTALAGTLLYFDLRARKASRPPPPDTRYPQLPPRDLDPPERP
jgi:hypothetical protein